VRAAGGAATFRRGRRQPVHLVEVPVHERAPILQAWLGRTGMSPVPVRYLGVDRRAPLSDFERISSRHPVFRVINAVP